MCGRYKMSTKSAAIIEVFGVDEVPDDYDPPMRFNIAPTDPVPVIVRSDEGKRILKPMKWGLIPFWAEDPRIGSRMINARVETLRAKSAFKEPLEKRRCLVVADGFYEWKGEGKQKQPHLVCFEDRHVYAYAGLWARWRPKRPDGTVGDAVESCTIITVPPNTIASQVHDRMPLIFDPKTDGERIAQWLDTSVPVDIASFKEPRELPGLVLFPVDKRVGNVKNDDATLAEPLVIAQPTLL